MRWRGKDVLAILRDQIVPKWIRWNKLVINGVWEMSNNDSVSTASLRFEQRLSFNKSSKTIDILPVLFETKWSSQCKRKKHGFFWVPRNNTPLPTSKNTRFCHYPLSLINCITGQMITLIPPPPIWTLYFQLFNYYPNSSRPEFTDLTGPHEPHPPHLRLHFGSRKHREFSRNNRDIQIFFRTEEESSIK